MAERGYAPSPREVALSEEAERARRAEREPQREILRDEYDCSVRNVPAGEVAMQTYAHGDVALDVLASDPTRRGFRLRCPLLGAVSDLVDGKIGPGEQVVDADCLNCPHHVLAESRLQPSLLPPQE